MALCAIAALVLSLTGCDQVSSLVKSNSEAVYYNGYLGMTVTVPTGVYVKERSQTNLTETPEESMDPDGMEAVYDEDYDYYDIDFLYVESENSSRKSDHAALSVFAEYYPANYYSSFDEYLDELEFYYTYDYDGYTYEMKNKDTMNLGSKSFTRFVIEVTTPDSGDTYMNEYCIAEVEGMYVIVYINYWTDSAQSKKMALAMRDGVAFA